MVNNSLIAKYLDSLARVLANQSDLASVTGHPGDTGANREEVLQSFINNHTPKKMEAILGGKILGLGQKPSKQIDCMVCSDLAPRFKEQNRSIAIVEAVGVAISVKSHLGKKEIIDSIENLASIPQISMDVLSESSSVRKNRAEEYSKIAPINICFGYTGINPDTLMWHMIDYYNENFDKIPQNRRIRSVIVNGKYVIKMDPNGLPIENGVKIKPYDYHWSTFEDRPGVGLAELTSYLSDMVTWYNQLKINYHHYLNEAYIEEKE